MGLLNTKHWYVGVVFVVCGIFAFWARSAFSDVVHLENGNTLEGNVKEKGETIRVEFGSGAIEVSKDEVVKIVEREYDSEREDNEESQGQSSEEASEQSKRSNNSEKRRKKPGSTPKKKSKKKKQTQKRDRHRKVYGPERPRLAKKLQRRNQQMKTLINTLQRTVQLQEQQIARIQQQLKKIQDELEHRRKNEKKLRAQVLDLKQDKAQLFERLKRQRRRGSLLSGNGFGVQSSNGSFFFYKGSLHRRRHHRLRLHGSLFGRDHDRDRDRSRD